MSSVIIKKKQHQQQKKKVDYNLLQDSGLKFISVANIPDHT